MSAAADEREPELAVVADPLGQYATVQPPRIASDAAILGLVASEAVAAGVAGESRAVRLLYLIVTSRLLNRPCSIVLKGPSAGGKSYLVGQVLELFPSSAYHALSAMSDKALAYDTEPLVHRMLVIYEAAGMQGDMASYLMRSLLSEGRINYVTVDRPKGGGLGPRTIFREGPTGLITTTTSLSLHPENETRLLSLTVTDTPGQTRAIMRAHALGAGPSRDRSAWHQLQAWIADQPATVEVPYALALAEAIPPVAVRLRRDFPTLLTLIRAHALLHQLSRQRDASGSVIATLTDYAVVRELVSDLMADAAERTIPGHIRETVAVVAALHADDLLGDGVTYTQVAKNLGIDKSTAKRRSLVALNRGFLRNLETGRGRPARLTPGDPLAADASLLPTVEELIRLHGCAPNADDGAIEDDYPRSAWDPEPSDEDPQADDWLWATVRGSDAGHPA